MAFFIWCVARGKIFTIDNFIKRRLVNVNWCCMCTLDVELVSHLLIHTKVAQELWTLILGMFGIVCVFPTEVVGLIYSWKGAWVGIGGRLGFTKEWIKEGDKDA